MIVGREALKKIKIIGFRKNEKVQSQKNAIEEQMKLLKRFASYEKELEMV